MKTETEVKTVFLLVPLFLLLIALSAIPLFSASAEFTGDDFYYIHNNPLVTTPGLQSLARIWRSPMKIEYFPVTITSYALEYRLWGSSIRLYHLTNLLIFAAIGLAAWRLAIRLSWQLYPENRENGQHSLVAAAATLLMLSHPLNVESVAAISNRKELLYVLFALLSLCCYLSKENSWKKFFGVLFFMVLAQLSKGSAVILPGLFWVCELFIGRNWQSAKRLFLPAVSSLLAVFIFVAQFRVAYRAGVVEKSADIDLISRFGGTIRSLDMMLGKFFLPVNLSYDYDFIWPKGLPSFQEWLLPLAVVSALLLMLYKKRYEFLSISLLMLLTLVPYCNMIPLHHNNSGQMVFYDHYLLFATMLCASLLTMLLLALQERARIKGVAAAIVLSMLLTSYNFYLFRFWKDRESLYSRIIQISPSLPKGYLFLGKALNEKGRYKESIDTLSRLFTLNNWFPVYLEAYREIGNAYAFSGQMSAAETAYRNHLEYQPKDRTTLQNLSATLIAQSKYEDARAIILSWLTYYPGDSDAIHNLQLCEQMLGMN